MNSIDRRLERLRGEIKPPFRRVTSGDIETLARRLHRERCARSGCNMEHVDLYWTVVDQDAYRAEAMQRLSTTHNVL